VDGDDAAGALDDRHLALEDDEEVTARVALPVEDVAGTHLVAFAASAWICSGLSRG
jgi:hypothetical protein